MTNGTGRQFMQKTQYKYLERSQQQQQLQQPPLELSYDANQTLLELPNPNALAVESVYLQKLIERRSSVRSYAEEALSLVELSFLLWCTQGIQEMRDTYMTRRTVPSAGARHAFETFLLVNRVTGIEPGAYRFLASAHSLIDLDLGADITSRITQACLKQEQVTRSAVTFMWIAVPERMTWRYGERGYRYLHLDAGHVCQNLYLAAENIGCGVCAIAAFDDELMYQELALEGEQFVIYVATVGKKRF